MNNYNYNNQQQGQPVPPPLPPPKKEKYSFRWGLFLGIPLVIIVALLIAHTIRLPFRFRNIARFMQIDQLGNFTKLVSLMVIAIAFILIVKAVKK
jgi:hypothetical protein